jgi:hypothetical protein
MWLEGLSTLKNPLHWDSNPRPSGLNQLRYGMHLSLSTSKIRIISNIRTTWKAAIGQSDTESKTEVDLREIGFRNVKYTEKILYMIY